MTGNPWIIAGAVIALLAIALVVFWPRKTREQKALEHATGKRGSRSNSSSDDGSAGVIAASSLHTHADSTTSDSGGDGGGGGGD